MVIYTRRELGRLWVAAAPLSRALGKPNSLIGGVPIGVQSYSFRDRPLDQAIEDMARLGLSYCELGNNHMEPKGASREQLRKWRLRVPLEEFTKARRKFDAAGIKLVGYAYAFRDDFTEEEVSRGFDMARALGVNVITSSANVDMAERIDVYAKKWKIRVGMHNHSRPRPNDFVTPEDFAAGMRGRSPYIGVNLDVGHFWAAGYDPVAYLAQHHQRMTTIHLKDRKKNQGPNTPFGEGDTPLRQILLLLKQNRWNIPAVIEYEYQGADTVVEVGKCLEYCRQALAG